MTTDIDELLGVLYLVIDDLTTALSERYQNVNIDLRISAKRTSTTSGITPFGVDIQLSRFTTND